MIGAEHAAKEKEPIHAHVRAYAFAFAGRDELIDDVIEGLSNQPGDPNRATIFIGTRGSGKTVLLSAIAEEASDMGMTNASNIRRRLIDRVIINDLRMGLVDFDMAIFRTYLREHPAQWYQRRPEDRLHFTIRRGE